MILLYDVYLLNLLNHFPNNLLFQYSHWNENEYMTIVNLMLLHNHMKNRLSRQYNRLYNYLCEANYFSINHQSILEQFLESVDLKALQIFLRYLHIHKTQMIHNSRYIQFR